jgi:hypothetical protein
MECTQYHDGKSQLSPALPSTDLHHQSQLAHPIHRALDTLTLAWFNSGFRGRQIKRQYPRPRQVIIGSTLAPGRLVNRARVHALAMTFGSGFMTATSLEISGPAAEYCSYTLVLVGVGI